MRNEIDRFLSRYNTSYLYARQELNNYDMNCNDATIVPKFNQSCFFHADDALSLCSRRDNYGYSEGSPCVLIKFNNIIGWVPQPIIDQSQLYQIPEHLRIAYQNGHIGPWVDCQPNTAVDRENLGNNLKYAPVSQELPRRYFPYLNQRNYMSPFVAIKFTHPARNVYIGITCRLWSPNLSGDVEGYRYKPSAILPFHLFIE